MNNVFSITALSMNHDLNGLNVISNNLANVNTTAYKRDFQSPTSFIGFMDSNSTIPSQISYPHKVTDYESGTFKYTGNPLDVAISGTGFLEVQTQNGNLYTKDGVLKLDSSGKLITNTGYTVEGMSGEIRISGNNPYIDKHGNVWENNDLIGRLKISYPNNIKSMKKLGSGLYMSTAPMNVANSSTSINVRQGYTESSNVNTMDEMVNLMSTMRHFELSQKVVKAYDELLDTSMKTIGEF